MLRIDHVGYAVRDLDEAALVWRRDHGLDSLPGGRHAGWGTANRIVPLGDQYVELISVVDPAEAATTVFGRSMLARLANGGGWFLVVVATDDLDAEAARRGLSISDGRRTRPDGAELSWRSAGFEDPRREPWMPFFIQWTVGPELHPGRTRAGHGVRVDGVCRVEVGGDGSRLRGWLGDGDLPIRAVGGPPGIRAVAFETPDGELVVA
ncbi:MAG: VOC family protein [Actinomycetota bacterium]